MIHVPFGCRHGAMRRARALWTTTALAVLILTGCSSASRVPTPTPKPSPPSTIVATAALPTATLTPTSEPTRPAQPTPTPVQPAPTPVVEPSVTPRPVATPANRPDGQAVDLPDVDTSYNLDITSLDVESGTVDVDERVDINSRQGSIPTLYFTVTTVTWGYFHLATASINDVPVAPKSLNGGFTLALSPPPGDRWTVRFTYTLKLSQVPRDWYGTGLDGTILRLGYWFPMLSTNFPYPSTADPAYSRSASFDVSLPLRDDVPFVSTGVEVSRARIDDSHSRHELHADDARDFALVIAPGGRIEHETTSNGVTIQLLSDPKTSVANRNTELAAAKKAIETLSRLIGPYPYPIFSMAEGGPSLPGGIEFPMLIDLNPNIQPLNRLVYHETAHQWLYGLIGTRPQQDIWIDEGGAQFIEGFLDAGSPLPAVPNGGYPYPLDSTDAELPQGAGIPGYASIYWQGQRFYQTVLDTMGSEAFWSAMQDLYQTFKYGIVTPWDVLSAWQSHSRVDLRSLFRATFRYAWIDQLPAPGG